MKLGRLFKSSVVALVAAGLVLTAVAAAPPKPGPRPGPKGAPRPGRRLIGKRPLRPIVRPIVPARVGAAPGAVVRAPVPVYRPTMVTHRVIAPTQATSADQLAAVPRQEVSKADSYQVVDVGEDYLVKVMVEGAPTRVRMLGVEPPLTASPEHPDGGVPKSALQFARNLLVGEFVCLLNDPGLEQRDADNNLVAYLYRAPDELLINLELIRQGYAVAAQAYSFEYRESFLAYQQKAQSDGKGIWGQLPTASP